MHLFAAAASFVNTVMDMCLVFVVVLAFCRSGSNPVILIPLSLLYCSNCVIMLHLDASLLMSRSSMAIPSIVKPYFYCHISIPS